MPSRYSQPGSDSALPKFVISIIRPGLLNFKFAAAVGSAAGPRRFASVTVTAGQRPSPVLEHRDLEHRRDPRRPAGFNLRLRLPSLHGPASSRAGSSDHAPHWQTWTSPLLYGDSDGRRGGVQEHPAVRSAFIAPQPGAALGTHARPRRPDRRHRRARTT